MNKKHITDNNNNPIEEGRHYATFGVKPFIVKRDEDGQLTYENGKLISEKIARTLIPYIVEEERIRGGRKNNEYLNDDEWNKARINALDKEVTNIEYLVGILKKGVPKGLEISYKMLGESIEEGRYIREFLDETKKNIVSKSCLFNYPLLYQVLINEFDESHSRLCQEYYNLYPEGQERIGNKNE